MYCFESVEGISDDDDNDDNDNDDDNDDDAPVVVVIEDTGDWSEESVVGGTESVNVMDFLFPPPGRRRSIALRMFGSFRSLSENPASNIACGTDSVVWILRTFTALDTSPKLVDPVLGSRHDKGE